MIRILGFVLLLQIVVGCHVNSGKSNATLATKSATVTGTVTYRERIAMPLDSVIEVQLLDVSLADAAAVTIAEQAITPEHQVPISFELNYDPLVIDERMRYVVRATISHAGKIMFTTDRSYPVLTDGNPTHINLVLVRTHE